MSDKPNFFEQIKNGNFSVEMMQDYIQNHTKQMLFVCLGLVIILILLSLLIFTSPDTKGKKKTKSTNELVVPLHDNLILPEEPGFPAEFQFYRERRSTWTREEAEEWFVAPDEVMLENLENANNNVISDILGAAP